MDSRTQWLDTLQESLGNDTFVKTGLGNYKGAEEGLRNIYIKKILVKREEKLSFTYRYHTKDIVKNYAIIDGLALIQSLVGAGHFRVATLFTIENDLYFEYINENKMLLRKKPASAGTLPSLDHDKQKNRLITSTGKPYLYKLKITDENGTVYKAAQDKYRQINHYIEILSSLLKNLPKHDVTNIADMGAGKGYLTFALYDYLTNVLHLNATVTGVEYRKELVDLCNEIAQKSSFDKLHFVQGTIQDYDSTGANVLIALHACDTATDDAIYKGITAGADLIVVAPCCHKQIRREIEKHKVHNDLEYLTRHGIYMERQAEMATDGIRALIMEYSGYSTKIFEFVSDVHTPKNIMLVGEKNLKALKHKEEIRDKIKAAKSYFGIGRHHLETLLGL
jgi:hypothetical protein